MRARLLRRPRHLRVHQMAARGIRSRRHRRRGRSRPGARGPRGHQGQGARHRRHRLRRHRHAGDLRQRVPLLRHGRQCHVREQVPARERALAAAHREASRGGGPPVRRQVRGPWLHGQGQRPGALRIFGAHAGSGAHHHRAGAQLGSRLPGRRDRVGGGPRRASEGHDRQALFHRRQSVGPGHRVRRAGRSLVRAAGGHLDHDVRSGLRAR